MTNRRSTLIALTLLAAVGIARADVVEVQWDDADRASHEFQIKAQGFAEWCTKLRSGEKVKWHFEAGTAINFNIHYHEGKEVRYAARQDRVARADSVLDVSVDQDYCWMWSNKSPGPIAVTATLAKLRPSR